jgi:hypothetical protein
MKRYILGYRTRPKEPLRQGYPEDPLAHYDIGYSAEPAWTMHTREEAEAECGILRGLRVHLGEHYCSLDVEVLPNSEYAIVCLTHPENARVTE